MSIITNEKRFYTAEGRPIVPRHLVIVAASAAESAGSATARLYNDGSYIEPEFAILTDSDGVPFTGGSGYAGNISGIVADGVTDNTAALQAAFNDETMKVIIGPVGTLCWDSPVVYDRVDNISEVIIDFSNTVLKPRTTDSGLYMMAFDELSSTATTTLSANVATSEDVLPLTSVAGGAVGDLLEVIWTNPTYSAVDAGSDSIRFVSKVRNIIANNVYLQNTTPDAIQSGWVHTVRFIKARKNIRLIAPNWDLTALGNEIVVTAISKANPAVLTATGTLPPNGETVVVTGPLAGMTEIRGAQGLVQNVNIGAGTFEIAGVNSTGYTTYNPALDSGKVFVRQYNIALYLDYMEDCHFELFGFGNKGSGPFVYSNALYECDGWIAAEECGSNNLADMQLGGVCSSRMEFISKSPIGFGAEIQGNHSTLEISQLGAAEYGRGMKLARAMHNIVYFGEADNPGFTGVSLTWASQNNVLIAPRGRGSQRGNQQVGLWTSSCYNIDNTIVGGVFGGNGLYDIDISGVTDTGNRFSGCRFDPAKVRNNGGAHFSHLGDFATSGALPSAAVFPGSTATVLNEIYFSNGVTWDPRTRVRSTAAAGTGAGPIFSMSRDIVGVATTLIGGFDAFSGDAAGNSTRYGLVCAQIVDPVDGTEDGRWTFWTMQAGTLTQAFNLEKGFYASTLNDPGAGKFNGVEYQVNNTKVLGARATGWGAPTGTATRTTFATSTVTLPLLAERVKALIDDLTTHGIIGA